MILPTISIQQPWAWLICNGPKDVENRDWYSIPKGQIFIHAGKKFDFDGYDWAMNIFPEMPDNLNDFDLGGIVGMAYHYDTVREYDSKWFVGKFGFLLRERIAIKLIPLRGQLGFFNSPDISITSSNNSTARRPPNEQAS